MEQEQKISGMRKYCLNCPHYKTILWYDEYNDRFAKAHKDDDFICATLQYFFCCEHYPSSLLSHKDSKRGGCFGSVIFCVTGKELYKEHFDKDKKDTKSYQEREKFFDTHDCPLSDDDENCICSLERFTEKLRMSCKKVCLK